MHDTIYNISHQTKINYFIKTWILSGEPCTTFRFIHLSSVIPFSNVKRGNMPRNCWSFFFKFSLLKFTFAISFLNVLQLFFQYFRETSIISSLETEAINILEISSSFNLLYRESFSHKMYPLVALKFNSYLCIFLCPAICWNLYHKQIYSRTIECIPLKTTLSHNIFMTMYSTFRWTVGECWQIYIEIHSVKSCPLWKGA